MPVHTEARAFLDTVAAAGIPPSHQLTAPAAREAMAARRALFAPAEPEPIEQVEDRTIPGPAGAIPVRVYTPSSDGNPRPVLLYFHGGGWVVGNLDSHDGVCRALANAAGCAVVSVDYRLAPEHRYPAAADDCYAATRWIGENGAALGLDGGRLAVGGDSAGGNLAAAVALMARDRGAPAIALQLLIYPVTDANLDTSSYLANAEGYGLLRADMAWFWDQYVPDAARRREPLASPLQAADLRGLPPALVLTAEYDVLRDEGEAYAERLRQAGVPAALSRYDGLIHGFFGMATLGEVRTRAIGGAADALRSAFGA